MRLLLDTHVFLWWSEAPQHLPKKVADILIEPGNQLLLSVASVWEMQIKIALGKLELTLPLGQLIREQCVANGFEVLDVKLPHILALESLPALHGDPFDRLLLAQSRAEDAVLVSGDPRLSDYPVRILWAD